MSASETHNRQNVNRSVAESLAALRGRAGTRARGGLRCEAVISTSFGCPYEGHVPPERVLEIAQGLARLRRAGDRLRRHHRHGQPGAGRGFLRAGVRVAWRLARADGSHDQRMCSSPPISTTPAVRDLPMCWRLCRPASRVSSRALASWAAVPCRPARPATSPARISSRCCTRWVSPPASTSTRCSPVRAACRRCSAARLARTRSWRAGGLALAWRAGRLGLTRLLAHRRHAVLLHRHLHLQRLRKRGPGGGVDHTLGASHRHVRVGQ